MIIALGLLGCLGAPVALVLLVVALVSDRRQHRLPPQSRYHTRVWVGGHRTRKGQYRRGHWKRR